MSRHADAAPTAKTQTRSDAILTCRDLSVEFTMDRGTSTVLNGLDIDIERNEIIGIVGESGSGKSMFASALLDAVVEPGVTTGTITYRPAEGREIDVLDRSDDQLQQLRWEDISMVFQGALSSFNPTLKLRGHFVETLEAHGYDVESGMERTHELLSDLYLDPGRVLGSYPHELSGGMKQRALIALSLVLEPDVLVMDEPTAALDLLMQRSIISLLSALREKYDLTMVFITHDLPLVTKLADRIGVLYAFELAEVSGTEELLRSPRHPYTRALLNSTPDIESPLAEMQPIEGSAPDPVDVPPGCPYHERCPLATADCAAVKPAMEAASETHDVACHYWERVPDEIDLTTEVSR
ncbi:ABC transporter ATP-binding protein [Natrialba asiatica]|uniref:Nickel import system ATP-binding protein NikD n=1 Tax=Natrialba asiatica (strain ATCC 700177 / DSM 12278 / JCM 9576 / FERM P-10747 / NBRC 102637 / 172P1) TaxID=29540 RepID=M0B5M1_NATA1|nr:ABC transporter ATP-binding protein [Natrialba asiatica]ELZ05538.1 oligopeptide/dipeptide ABC transporter, ATPase subunit [Natrialba asiatica DSM 12278]